MQQKRILLKDKLRRRSKLKALMHESAKRIQAESSRSKKPQPGKLNQEIAEIEAENVRQSEKLRFSKILTEPGAYYWDDKLTVRAFKTDPQTKVKLPLKENWRNSRILEGIETGQYFDSKTKTRVSQERLSTMSCDEIEANIKPVKNYFLNHRALRWMDKDVDQKSILNDIRLEVTSNEVDIILTGLLIGRAPESRLKLITETIRALVGEGVIKGNWKKETETTRPYRIFKDYFYVHEYEVRIDSGRYGSDFYKACKRNSPATKILQQINKEAGEIFNQVKFFPYNPKKPKTKNEFKKGETIANRVRGYQMVIYDRALKDENRKSKIDPDLFPFRTEVRLKKRALEGMSIQGNGQKIIQRLKNDLESILLEGVIKMKAGREFDLFVNKRRRRNPKSTKEIIHDLIENGSFLSRLEQIEGRVDNIEEILKYHGLTLPKQRGAKII